MSDFNKIIYKYDSSLVKGKLVKRYKRFLADIELESGELITAHCVNTGSMKGLLKDRALVYCSENNDPKRKTKHNADALCLHPRISACICG